MRYFCCAKAIYAHFIRIRYDINSRSRSEHIACETRIAQLVVYRKFFKEFISLWQSHINPDLMNWLYIQFNIFSTNFLAEIMASSAFEYPFVKSLYLYRSSLPS